jgi:S-adenosylmethionine-diacylgycerolhomoserine-N-methlytransferase
MTQSGIHQPAAAQREAMDDIYRYQRFIYDVTRRYYLFGRNEMIANLAPPPGAHILEFGCGTARNLIHTARAYPDARLFGFDISAEMLTTAKQSVERHGLASRIALAQADATLFQGNAAFGITSFDRIFISYSLSMIPDWQLVLSRAATHLAPGGELHIVDFGDMTEMPALLKRALRSWLARFSVTPRDNLRTALAATARQHGLAHCLWHGRGHYAVHAVVRHT